MRAAFDLESVLQRDRLVVVIALIAVIAISWAYVLAGAGMGMMRKEKEKGVPYVPTGVFAFGYLVMWAVFSAVATGAQWGLETSGLLSRMMVGTSAVLGAILLIAAGIWQITPLKHACLKHCRSPVGFLSAHWRPGRTGAFRMGLVHGAFCLGCCWFLMALLFYGGVMNLFWIIGLSPGGQRLGAAGSRRAQRRPSQQA